MTPLGTVHPTPVHAPTGRDRAHVPAATPPAGPPAPEPTESEDSREQRLDRRHTLIFQIVMIAILVLIGSLILMVLGDALSPPPPLG